MRILANGFAAPVETSQEDIVPSSELAVLKCLLSSPLNGCDDSKRSVMTLTGLDL
ncbi:hypothetical protein RUM44_008164 [Polyplax serrata]|uniref:Uncharacterized protein n=1 Tax=Polyplax serrata TaxID=468196 RepID=A0ABR1BBN4_POLSC